MFPVSDPDLIRRRFPVVNLSLIAICTVVFIYELFLGGTDRQVLFFQFGLIPAELTHGADYTLWNVNPPFGRLEDIATPFSNWITLFSSMFLHSDWLHYLSNMLFLWVFGDNIEDRFGHFRYLLFYLGAGLAAAWMQIAIDVDSEIPVIGASGAIAGVLGAYLLLYPYSRIRTAVVFFLIFLVRIPAVLLLGFWVLLQFMGGIGSLGSSAHSGGVAYWAHTGGLVFGVLVVVLYRRARNEPLWPRPPTPPTPPPVQYWRGRPL